MPMSENIDLHGLLTAALDSHVLEIDPDTYPRAFVKFRMNTDVTVRPPFERDNLLGIEWDGTTGTRSYMLPTSVMQGKYPVERGGVDVEGHHLRRYQVFPYFMLDGTPNHSEGSSLIGFNSCAYFAEGETKITDLSLYDLLALAAAQDAQDPGVAQTLREAVISGGGTCRLSVQEREDLLNRFVSMKTSYVRRKSHNIRTTRQVSLIDPLTNAITDNSNGAITPADYFTDQGREIDTGNGGVALLDIRASDDADIDDVTTYVADNQTRYWLDHLYPLVLDSAGNGYEVHGSELLRHAGFKNPYDKKQEPVMSNAFTNILKAMHTLIRIDVTREKRNKRGNNRHLIESTELLPIVGGTMTVDRYEEDGEEVRDFTITVKPNIGEDVIDKLPLAKYAQARGMLTNYTQDEIIFPGIRQTLDDRRMWAYVLRRIKTRGLSGTIKFETMWKDLQVDEGLSKNARRMKRSRMLGKLEKMLDQKKGDLFLSWTWKKDADGRVEGVQIRRKKN